MKCTILMIAACTSMPADAHSGGLNAQGCHNNRKTGDYHCHRAPSPPPPPRKQSIAETGPVYFPNCSAARAAGAAPIRAGHPGYSRHLDRDGDGIACE